MPVLLSQTMAVSHRGICAFALNPSFKVFGSSSVALITTGSNVIVVLPAFSANDSWASRERSTGSTGTWRVPRETASDATGTPIAGWAADRSQKIVAVTARPTFA